MKTTMFSALAFTALLPACANADRAASTLQAAAPATIMWGCKVVDTPADGVLELHQNANHSFSLVYASNTDGIVSPLDGLTYARGAGFSPSDTFKKDAVGADNNTTDIFVNFMNGTSQTGTGHAVLAEGGDKYLDADISCQRGLKVFTGVINN